MIVTHNVTMDLADRMVPQIDAMQDDQYTRDMAICLMNGTEPWPVPEDATVVIRYCKSDGVGGEYDTLPDGTRAWSVSENVLTLALAPQVLTVPGTVTLSATLIREEQVLSTFSVMIHVRPQVGGIYAESEPYRKVMGFLPGPVNAQMGQYLRVARVDENGYVVALEGADGMSGGSASTSDTVLKSLKLTYGVSQNQNAPPKTWVDTFPEMSDEYPYLWIKVDRYYSDETAVADVGVIGYYSSGGSCEDCVKTVNGIAPDENGNVEVETGTPTDEQVASAVENYLTENPVSGGGGISTTAINLLTEILQTAMFTANVSGKIESLKEALLAGSSGDSSGGGGDIGGDTDADEITFADGMLTIISVGSEVSVANGIMTIL